MQIRPALPDELSEVGRITAAAYVTDGHLEAAHGYAEKLRDALGRSREAEVWVAVRDGQLLGSVTFCPAGSSLREVARAGEGEFRMLAVAAEARGQGVGRALVEHCLLRARELGYHGVRMSSMDRMASAHRVYERLGFSRAPEDDWSPEPHVVLHVYAARLAPV